MVNNITWSSVRQRFEKKTKLLEITDFNVHYTCHLRNAELEKNISLKQSCSQRISSTPYLHLFHSVTSISTFYNNTLLRT